MESIRGTCSPYYSAEAINEWANPERHTVERHQRAMGLPGAALFVVEHRGDGSPGKGSGRSEIAGFSMVVVPPGAAVAEIHAVYVAPRYQGYGVGGTALSAAVAHAREQGATRAVLDASVNAQGFYRRHGFRHEAGARSHCLGDTCVGIACYPMYIDLTALDDDDGHDDGHGDDPCGEGGCSAGGGACGGGDGGGKSCCRARCASCGACCSASCGCGGEDGCTSAETWRLRISRLERRLEFAKAALAKGEEGDDCGADVEACTPAGDSAAGVTAGQCACSNGSCS